MGINAEGLGRDHWNEMLAYPRKPIAHWHSLVEVKKSFKEVGEVALGPWHACCMAVRAGEWPRAASRPRLRGPFPGEGVGVTRFSPSVTSREEKEEDHRTPPDKEFLMWSKLKATQFYMENKNVEEASSAAPNAYWAKSVPEEQAPRG